MNSDPDPLGRDIARLRRKKGFCPMTPEEADAELAATPDEPLPPDEVERLLLAATSGVPDVEEPLPDADTGWRNTEEVCDELEEEMLQLNRNAGDDDDETSDLLDEHRRKALGDEGNGTEERPGNGQAST
ncbi:hypothetical protein AYO40_02580 [Planctomycetaceae bacterium SCGC AG-212-D15]|nr:hypothetical protein AYO40_02580 [Planctomycetaceae bacterium SCGC AG-212-D15]